MFKKKDSYINTTPIPPNIPRQLALDLLHSHSEIITLNPLVLSHNPIKAPRDAPADEYYHTWYEIHERVQYIPGIGKLGSGKISFKGSFHNTSLGIYTHTYVPLGIELKSKWHVGGSQPDEPPEPVEQRPEGAPANGLYLHEDIEIIANRTLISFVKSQLKAASKVLIERLIKKAELLDAGVLQAMFEDGKLRTINPADRTMTFSQQPSMFSPTIPSDQRSSRWSASGPTRSGSMSSTSTGSHAGRTPSMSQYSVGPGHYRTVAAELPGSTSRPQSLPAPGKHFEIAEMEGSGHLPDQGFRSPKLYQGHAVELPAMTETSEEHASNRPSYQW
ncbi:hypothetical protein N7468_004510 [Penicillium chermesinum]|uniref:DUF7053 domain-containing protein n=1 Tax=Penicillium chermesinum TaxID=63820 RepID=A0A9W9P9C0_9EURO|nr:uncharacterized protein N7468_004510 [Penicillium chermesinum]KAJ5239891.1 hypothetical protein N7468_004510 [Penicillium chermesinum]KAJ6166769.1 hypothetical protein N7470_002216 [Penicillium chermesinum]